MNDEDRKILENIRAAFGQAAADDERLADFAEKLKNGQIDYADARKYARLIGDLTSDALLKFAEEIQTAADGYEPVLETLRDAYGDVAGYAETAQQAENAASGLGLKAIRPVFNENTASGIAAKASNAETVEEAEKMLSAPVKNFTEKVVNDTIEENVRYQHNAGLHPKVIRSGGHKCCEWCAALSGKFEYGEQPNDFFKQHENCTCMIEFSGNGSKYRVNGKWNKGAGSSQKSRGTKIRGREIEERIGKEKEKQGKQRERFKSLLSDDPEGTFGEPVHNSVGAKHRDTPSLKNPLTDEDITFVEGSRPFYPSDRIMAGKGCKTGRKIDIIDDLQTRFEGVDSQKWTKEKAIYQVYDDYGVERSIEIHYYRHPDIDGRVDEKIKVKNGSIYRDEW